ncbi:hydrogenase maturation protein [Streptomyces bathyalis]|uniref:Hydrogenase maturation protein n=1 Tax=Streptomyces bathyalis TaxID=2710756 RepID=A0A7T1T516_9ACTN|nr:hydrogenase maturation protein [Streptomyces bathyalis]QPP06524.1 hydrogenase maturation protein [Streptomyces bathyalis]
MRILLVASAFNSLTQRVYAELSDLGHRLDTVCGGDDDAVREAVSRHDPALIVAPMLKTALPEDVFSRHVCLVVHPGPPGDRGPSALDWAIATGARHWAVTVLQADAEMDAGDIWATVPFALPEAGKSDLYRNEMSDAAATAVKLAVARFASGAYKPRRQEELGAEVVWRPYFRQERRRIDWAADSTGTVLRKLRAADSQPGVLDELLGAEWFLHGGHPESALPLRGAPGEIVATRAAAVCRATRDGAVWIPQLRPRRTPGGPATFRMPAVDALGPRLPESVPEVPARLEQGRWGSRGWTDIRYEQRGPVGFIWFSFPGGAMSTDQCRRLLAAYRHALSRPTSVLVLGSRRDFFSNGIHLGVIEAAADPGGESWANINAMDDLVEAVLLTTDRLVVAALGGNAAAGGVMLALAADEVWCREGAVLNPHYRLMGLYGSEYWTYTLPRRVGAVAAERMTREALPVSAASAADAGLVDRLVATSPADFAGETSRMAAELARSRAWAERVAGKAAARARDEAEKPLAQYREEELAVMRGQFFGAHEPYHALRRAFVRKEALRGAEVAGAAGG